jgi:hypothetical protein
VTSTATNSPLTISLTGSGDAPVSHSVVLNWSPSSSTFAGFNVYRSSVSGSPYTPYTKVGWLIDSHDFLH